MEKIYISFEGSKLTIRDVLDMVAVLQHNHPDEEIFMDGDSYALVGRKHITP